MNDISRSIEITPRDVHFAFDAGEGWDWFDGRPERSIYMAALSLLFPAGEKFFMDSVKRYRDDIEDPVLRRQVAAFLRQEAMHTREHVQYNKQLDRYGFSANAIQQRVFDGLAEGRRKAPPLIQLAMTCALEHYTATWADVLLKRPELLDGCKDAYRRVWLWHALEESEHKGVAFDVYQHVTKGRGYWRRVHMMLITTVFFNLVILRITRQLMKDQGMSRDWRAWGRLFSYLFLSPGVMRRSVPALLDYFRPGFHPWDHDNRTRLAATEAALSSGRMVGQPAE